MADSEHLKILNQGVKAWNKWRKENPTIKPNLKNSDLQGMSLVRGNFKDVEFSKANLRGLELWDANLEGANLVESNLCETELYNVNLKKAHLKKAILKEAELSDANLYMTDLEEADLWKAEFIRANCELANFRGAYLYQANFIETKLRNSNLSFADLTGAVFSNSSLEYATMVETTLKGAKIKNCIVYGISTWNIAIDEKTEQSNLMINHTWEPLLTIDDIEVAQFIYFILNNEKLRNVVNSVTEKVVLILGRFDDGGIDVLRKVADRLRFMKYLPIIFDFGRPRDRTKTETVKTLVGLSRFVIVDLSGRSVPHELSATVSDYKIPFVPIIETGRQPYAMVDDILDNDWVLKPIINFDNTETLIEMIPSRIIEPAERQLKKRQKSLDERSQQNDN